MTREGARLGRVIRVVHAPVGRGGHVGRDDVDDDSISLRTRDDGTESATLRATEDAKGGAGGDVCGGTDECAHRFFFFFLVFHDEGLTRRELLVQDGETLFTLLRCFNGDEVLDLMRKTTPRGKEMGWEDGRTVRKAEGG